jgi:cytochrome c oxidase subunit 3
MLEAVVAAPSVDKALEPVPQVHPAACGPEVQERETESTVAVAPATAALWAILATVIMLFAGFSSAYLIRRTSPDWVPVYAPPILWFNTAILLLSSLALEIAKTSRKFGRQNAFRGWFLGAVGLGVVFLGGQWTAWKELAAQGIFLPTSPHSSFFYMLSGVHAFHVIAGLLALVYLLPRRWSIAGSPLAADPVSLCATYWHFVTGIWVYLYLLLFVWR